MAILRSLTINDTGSLTLPNGTTAQRPNNIPTVVTFTTVGTTSWIAPAGVTSVEVLVVAGGGGGGSRHGGGGGAGGLIYVTNHPVLPGTSYAITVGSGGAGLAAVGSGVGSNGENSIFDSLIAIGGGGGTSDANSVSNGGSGGGSRGNSSGQLGGTGVAGQGHSGGANAFNFSPYQTGGGGGGAGTPGQDGYDFRLSPGSGNGGNGLLISITGTPTYYAGGGGGSDNIYGGYGGLGGGGNAYNSGTGGSNGTANTGGGGGGGGHNSGTNYNGGNGGSGIVVIRYVLNSASQDTTGQKRFNTNTNSFESLIGNQWNSSAFNDPIIINGLAMNLDAKYHSSGSTWYDVSGRANNGTISGATYTGGSPNHFAFTGTNRVLVSNNSAFNETRGITIEAWVTTDSIGSYNIISMRTSTSAWTADGWGFNTHPGSLLSFWIGHYDNQKVTIPWTTHSQYKHLVATFDGRQQKIYVDGECLAIREYITTIPQPTSSIAIGNDPNTTSYGWEGKINNIKIYNRALTGGEVQENYNALANRFSQKYKIEGWLSAKQIKEYNPQAKSGFYWIKTQSMDMAVQAYCDMEFDGGGYMLIAYGFVNTTGVDASNRGIPNLNHNGTVYAYNPKNRASSHGLILSCGEQRSAVRLVNSSKEMIFAAGGNPSSGFINAYTYVYRVDIPYPKSVSFDNHATYSPVRSVFTPIAATVVGLKGDTGSFTKYWVAESLGCSWGDTYPTGYGLGTNTSARGAGVSFDGGPFFPSVHSGHGHPSYAPDGGTGRTIAPDVGGLASSFSGTGYGGNYTYTFRGWYRGDSAGSTGNTGQMSIWCR
jgi:hypothetical protein